MNHSKQSNILIISVYVDLMVIAYHYKKIGELIFIIHHLATVLPFYFVLVSKIYLWWQVMPKSDKNYYANVQWSELKFWLDCIGTWHFHIESKDAFRVLSALILPLKFISMGQKSHFLSQKNTFCKKPVFDLNMHSNCPLTPVT